MKKIIANISIIGIIFTGCNTIIEREATLTYNYEIEIVEHDRMQEKYNELIEKQNNGSINARLRMPFFNAVSSVCSEIISNTKEYNTSNDNYIKLRFYSDISLKDENMQNNNCLVRQNSYIKSATSTDSGHFTFVENDECNSSNFCYDLYISVELNTRQKLISTPQEDWTLSINYAPTFLWEFGKTFYLYSSNDVTISASDIEAVLAQIPENNTTDTNTTENNDTNSSGG